MIVYNPADYSVKGLNDDKFYADLCRSFRLNAKFVTIQPFWAHAEFICLNGLPGYWDPSNIALGVIAGTPTIKAIYHGSLSMSYYVGVGGVGVAQLALAQGYDNVGSIPRHLVAQINTGAAAAVVNNNDKYDYDSVAFSYLHQAVVAPGASCVCDYVFTGVRISF
jgi:hypothetical protein